jgi:hypothetical protein
MIPCGAQKENNIKLKKISARFKKTEVESAYRKKNTEQCINNKLRNGLCRSNKYLILSISRNAYTQMR